MGWQDDAVVSTAAKPWERDEIVKGLSQSARNTIAQAGDVAVDTPTIYNTPDQVYRDGQFQQVGPEYRRQEEMQNRLRATPDTSVPEIRAMGNQIVAGAADLGGLMGRTVLAPFSDPAAADEAHRLATTLRGQANIVSEQAMMPTVTKYGSQAVGTLAKVVPLAAGTGGVGVIAEAGLSRSSQALQEAKDAGLSEDKSLNYAARAGTIEAGITTLFQGLGKYIPGLKGLEGMNPTAPFSKEIGKKFVRDLGISTVAELTEEETIALLDSVNQAVSGVDPKATNAENLWQTMKETAAVTLATMGLAKAPSIAEAAMRPIATAGTLRTPEGATQFAAANPDAAASIIANPSRRNIAKQTGTGQRSWADQKRRESLVERLKAGMPPAAPASPEAANVAPTPTETTPEPATAAEVPTAQPADAAPATETVVEPTPQQQGPPPVGTKVRVISNSGKDWGETTISGYDDEGRVLFDKAIKTGTKRAMLEGVTLQPLEGAPTPAPQATPTQQVQPEPTKAEQIPAPQQTATPPDEDAPLSQWLQEKIAQDAEVAERIGIANEVEELASQELTAKQIAKRIADARGMKVSDVTDLVLAVRNKRRIPSMTPPGWQGGVNNQISQEFRDWQKGYRERKQPSAPQAVDPEFDGARNELKKYGVEVEVVDSTTDTHKAAADMAKSLGLKPVFVRFGGKKGFNGYANGKTILLDADLPTDQQTWYIAGHEIAHSSNVDNEIDVDDATVQKWQNDYLASIPQDNFSYLAYLESNPQNLRREAVAHMIGRFMTDSGFRAELEAGDPTLFQKIVKAVAKFFSGRKMTKEARATLNALKAKKVEAKAKTKTEAEPTVAAEPVKAEEKSTAADNQAVETPAPELPPFVRKTNRDEEESLKKTINDEADKQKAIDYYHQQIRTDLAKTRRGSKRQRDLNSSEEENRRAYSAAGSRKRLAEKRLEMLRVENMLEAPPSKEHEIAGRVRLLNLEADLLREEADAQPYARQFNESRIEKARALQDQAVTLRETLKPTFLKVAQYFGFDEFDADQAADLALTSFVENPKATITVDSAIESAAFNVRNNRGWDQLRHLEEQEPPSWNTKAKEGMKYGRLTADERKGFAQRIRDAAKNDKTWRDEVTRIEKEVDKLQADRTEKAKAEAEESARVAKEEAERAAVEKAQEARQRAIDRGREVRFWKYLKGRVKEETKKGVKGTFEIVRDEKGEDGQLTQKRETVSGLKFGPWGIHEEQGSDKDEQGNYQKPEKWFTLTHLATGLSVDSYNKQADAVGSMLLMNESGVDWSAKQPEINSAARHLRLAFNEASLDVFADDDLRERILSSVPPTDTHGIEADMLIDSTALGVGTKLENKRAIETLKTLAKEVPEFRYNPVFTFDGNALVFRDGYKFMFPAGMFGVAGGELSKGQTLGIILPDFDISLATAQDVVKEMLANAGFDASKSGANVKASWRGGKVMLTGHGEKWRITEGEGEARERAQKVLDAIRWKQPGQVDAPIDAKGPQAGQLLPDDTLTYRPAGTEAGNIKEQKADARKAKRAASKKAQSAADKSTKNVEGMAAGPVGSIAVKERPDVVPDVAKVPNEEVERRMSNAHGLRRRPLLERLTTLLGIAKNKATRANEFLPNTAEWAYENEWFRVLKEISQSEQDETLRTVAAIVDPIGPKQRILFERKLMIDNLIAAYRRGEPLRFGFSSLDEMLAYQTKLNDAISQVPEIQKALESRKEVVAELVQDLVDNDLLEPEALDNAESYFHHQVLSKYDAAQRSGAGAGRPVVKKYGFQRKRVQGDELSEEYDPNTDWIQAESEWMYEARVALAKKRALEDLEEKRDIRDTLKAQAKKQNMVNLVGGEANYNRIQELRSLIKESQESEDANESDVKKMRAGWIDELTKLDPTYPFRIKIAMHMGRLLRAWKKGEFTAPGFEDALNAQSGVESEEAASADDLDGQWFRFLNWAASERGDEKEGIAAKGIFKAIGDRNQFIKDELAGQFVTWQDLIPETHSVYQPEPGNYFYQALTLPEQIAEKIQSGLVSELTITPEDVRQVLVMAGPRKQLVLKNELVEQLNALKKYDVPGLVSQAAENVMSMWKRWQLLKPVTNLGYFVRNLLSDVEAAFGADFGIAKHIPQAFNELRDYYQTQAKLGLGNAVKLSMSDGLRAARDYGVLQAGMAANEIPDIAELSVFERFYSPDQKTLGQKLAVPYQRIKELHKFREALARYAAFLRYRELLQSGKLVNYGGAKPDVVKSIKKEMGVDAAAAHLSRNLLGDYGNLTVLGNWLRSKAMPFWSWNEINLKRMPRMIANARLEGKLTGKSSKQKQAVLTGVALMRLGWLAASSAAWNYLLFPDEEDELGEYDRAKVHIVTGRNPDGTIALLRNISAVGDFLEWFGINSIVSLLDNVEAGQMTIDEAIAEAAKDPINKLAQGLGPQFKAPLEIGAGKTIFPDVLNPRTIDREEALAQNLGIRDEYMTVKGSLLGTGQRGKGNYVQRMTGQSVVDPRENALNEVYDLRDRFLKKGGQDVPSGDANFKNMRQAAAQNDAERFAEARALYLKSGKGYSNFESSLKRLDPVAGALNSADEAKFVNEFLTPVQRQRLDVARQHARNLEVWMRRMWQDVGSKTDSPEQQASTRYQVNKSLMNAADTLAEAPPLKIAQRNEWRTRGDDAVKRITAEGTSLGELRTRYWQYLQTELKDPTARQARFNRFTQRLLQALRRS